MKTCQKLRAGDAYTGKQGLTIFEGIARETTGADAICMHIQRIPPGTRAKAHQHDSHETAIYAIEGTATMFYGDNLEHRMDTGPGDLIYIPAGVPHLPMNLSDTEVVAVIARTDPNEQESVVLRPDLEDRVPL